MNRQERYKESCNKVIKQIIKACKKMPLHYLNDLIATLNHIRDDRMFPSNRHYYINDNNKKMYSVKLVTCETCSNKHLVNLAPDEL